MENLLSSEGARARARANHAKNDAQKGCAMQLKGIILGCILLGLFWLFLFRFRNNRIHGISISKRTPILETEYRWQR